MTRDEIISMAWEVGFIEKWQECKGGIEIVKVTDIDKLERFAALVAVAEREAFAKVCEEHWKCGGNSMECADAIRTMEKK